MTLRKIIIILLVVFVCVFISFYAAKKLIRYFDRQQVIRYLESNKYISSDSPTTVQSNSIIDGEIRKIRETRTYSFPMFFSATVEKFFDGKSFGVIVDWLQKKSNLRKLKKMNVRFEYEQNIKEFIFDIVPSGIAEEYEDPFYADAFYMCFVTDPNEILEGFSVLLPYEYSDGVVHVSLTDNEGDSTDWLECETIDRFADLR